MQRRSSTPGRKLEIDTKSKDEAENDGVPRNTEKGDRQLSRSKSLNTILRSPKNLSGPTRRKCTDLFCLLSLAIFVSMLYSSYDLSSDGSPERLTNGLDYRGRVCGLDSQKDSPYLMWCTPTGQDTINWADPICVPKCPSEDDLPSVMCPLPKVHTEEEKRGPNDSLNIVHTVSQQVVPSETFATQSVFAYCVQDVMIEREVEVITELLDGAGFGVGWTHIKHQATELYQRWSLIVLAGFLAVVFALTYLVLLRTMARPLVYTSFFLVLIASGLCMMVCFQKSQPVAVRVLGSVRGLAPVKWVESVVPSMAWDIDVVPDVLSDMADSSAPVLESIQAEFRAKREVIQGAMKKGFDKVPTFMRGRLLNEVSKVREFSLEGVIRPFAGSYTMHAIFALGVCSLLLCYLLSALLLHSKKSIRLAIGCVEEACSVLFSIKTLLILPFIHCLAWCAVTGSFLMLITQVLSTIPVAADSLTIAGIEVQGVARTFHPGMSHMVHVFLWLFALLWVQEMVHVVCYFIASYASVQWFFSPFDGSSKRPPFFLLPRGLFIGLFFHLGSLAFVAFISAFVRALRWVWYFATKRKEDQGRIITNSVDCCLRLCESFMHYASSHILTEIALHGNQSFCACAANVGTILSANISNAAMLHGTEWLFTIVGTLSISAATAVTMVLAIHNPDVINVDALRDLDGADVNLFAVVGAVLGGCIGYSFMTLLDRVAETVMYCYLSCKEDNERLVNSPKSLARLVTLHEL